MHWCVSTLGPDSTACFCHPRRLPHAPAPADTYIANKPRVVRSGKLIQKAKELYGDHEGITDSDTPGPGPVRSATPQSARPPSPSPPQTQQVMRAAEARFVSAELAKSVADHLVQNYFSVVHQQCHIVDAPTFQRVWDAAGRDSDRLNPTNECLALVIMAWSARFSDHAAILGQGAPSLADVKGTRRGKSLCGWGDRRQAFAQAMTERAMQAVDQKGILRRASVASATALVLLEFLLSWDDVTRSNQVGRHLMSGAVEHYRSLAEGIRDDPTEESALPDRATGGTLFWVMMSRDAVSAALGGRAPSLTQEDLATLCEIVVNPVSDEVLAYITSDDPKILAGLGVIGIFKHMTMLFRFCSQRLSGPLARMRGIDTEAVRELWGEIDNNHRWAHIFRQKGESVTPPLSNALGWFRDSLNMRTQLTVAIHRDIERRLELERLDQAVNAADPSFARYLDALAELKAQSDARVLAVGREFVQFLSEYGTDVVFSAAFSCENVGYFVAHMVRSPTWGLGGPPGWTAERQVEEVGWGVGVLELAGWMWPGYSAMVEGLRDQLGHLAMQAQRRRALQGEQQRRVGQQQDPHGGGGGGYALPPMQAMSHGTSAYPPLSPNGLPVPMPQQATPYSQYGYQQYGRSTPDSQSHLLSNGHVEHAGAYGYGGGGVQQGQGQAVAGEYGRARGPAGGGW